MTILTLKIKPDYWPKPIPLRQFDWSAVTDNYEPGDPVGYGATQNEAIADLLELLADRIGSREDSAAEGPDSVNAARSK